MIRWVLVAAFGAALCTYCDRLHATNGVLWYPHPVLGPQAWWVPLLFAAAAVVGVAMVAPVRRLLGGRPGPPATLGEVAGDTVGFAAAYAYTAFGHQRPTVVAGVLGAFWLARVLRGVPAWLVLFTLLAGVAGPAFEAMWSALGFFRYHHPDFAGVPRWLPGIYLHAAFLTASMERLIRR